ncbi:uncharacterized protein N7469_006708 [Penicillium citrinum]|uniref:HNH nuclease domain-containing protein n=1 Tax=Penicillium citrinum TaxID=5077 RepID=A0A9W9NVC3_PENCI|nr:uncharacterized protein N7469_006708 [Penicillium citrinum]KAJ5226702.1 hypothetical protein N7469_006708 [Penicillium citrinum]
MSTRRILSQRLNSYTPLDANDNTGAFLMDFFSVLATDGKRNLQDDVSKCADDTTVRQLAESIRTGLVVPMKAQGGRTPTVLISSPRHGLEDSIQDIMSQNISPITRNLQYRLREHCLERDGFKCVVTGLWSRVHSHPAGAPTGNLETAHIIPFPLGAFESSNRPAVARHSEIWTNIRHYFPIIHTMPFSSNQINEERNVLMLHSSLHTEFRGFRICFEATTVTNQYRFRTFSDTETALANLYPANRLVQFRSHGGQWELPDRRLLQIHAAIANFLHMAGQAEAIEKTMRDYSECSGLAPGGGTNIEDLLAVSSLSLLSESRRHPRPANIHRPQSTDVDDKHSVERPRPQAAKLPGSENRPENRPHGS